MLGHSSVSDLTRISTPWHLLGVHIHSHVQNQNPWGRGNLYFTVAWILTGLPGDAEAL